MARDIGLMKKAVKLLPPVSIKEAVDLNLVLEELWRVTQEEMNFLTEAANMEEFSRKNKKVAFVKTPILYREYTTASVLVMEYIDGIPIDHKEELLAGGYDLDEIGSKFVDNFIKQVMDDGFFHADPHPGNVMIQGGKIVWIDMGMMGRLNERDRELIGQAIEGVALNDIGKIQDAVLALGEFKGKPNQSRLYTDIRDLMAKYGTADFGEIDIVEILTDLMDVMKENKIVMPHGLTLLQEELTHMEGTGRYQSGDQYGADCSCPSEGEPSGGRKLEETDEGYREKAVSLHAPRCGYPCAGSRFPAGCMKGQTKINLDLHASDDLAWLMRRLIRNIVLGLWVMALLISSSIICTTDMTPKIMGIPAFGVLGYFGALVILMYLFVKHFMKQ